MSRPVVLDLFCGQGGAAAGLMRAGFEVVGVDVVDHSARYPGRFIKADALDFLMLFGGDFLYKWASPPCQGYSRATAGNKSVRDRHVKLIAATRDLLWSAGGVWVIENVEQARSQMVEPVLLCGRMFGLSAEDADGTPLVLDRHRLFESNVPLVVPAHPKHDAAQVAGVYGGSRRARRLPGESLAEVAPRDRHAARVERGGGYVPRSLDVQRALLGGVGWMTSKGMAECIPPAYGQLIGSRLVAAGAEVAA